MDIEIIIKIVEYVVILAVAGLSIFKTIKTMKNQKQSLSSFLLYAVTEAEKSLGSGVGALKLRAVWKEACEVAPFLMKFISFEDFSTMVDDALKDARHLWETNEKVAEYVAPTEQKPVEVVVKEEKVDDYTLEGSV